MAEAAVAVTRAEDRAAALEELAEQDEVRVLEFAEGAEDEDAVERLGVDGHETARIDAAQFEGGVGVVGLHAECFAGEEELGVALGGNVGRQHGEEGDGWRAAEPEDEAVVSRIGVGVKGEFACISQD